MNLILPIYLRVILESDCLGSEDPEFFQEYLEFIIWLPLAASVEDFANRDGWSQELLSLSHSRVGERTAFGTQLPCSNSSSIPCS